jgi:hypothetical protein
MQVGRRLEVGGRRSEVGSRRCPWERGRATPAPESRVRWINLVGGGLMGEGSYLTRHSGLQTLVEKHAQMQAGL